ncbi:MAG: zinc ABC transporter substrate-binding protein [Burkholderiaceae bacterium]
MPIIRRARALSALLAALAFGPVAAAPTVVASIAPVHSLVAAVMDGVGEPHLLVPGSSSPHSHALRPSDARAIESAGLVVWVGPGLENFLERPIASLVRRGEVLRLVDTEGLRLLPLRDDHAHDHGHDHSHGHGDGAAAIDMHIWLDPANARGLAGRIGEALAGIDPGNAGTYRRNAERLRERLATLDAEIARQMAPLAGRRFVVFHDGYQYFERRYGLAQVGVLTVNPEVSPGAERIRRLRTRIAADGIACVFIEPQFSTAIAEAVIEGSSARIGRLDPLGARLAPGPELYPRLMGNLAASFRDCLAPSAATER